MEVLDELGFLPVKTYFYEKKKNPSLCRLTSVNQRCKGITFLSCNLKTSPFWVGNILVLRDAYCFLDHCDEFLRVSPKQKLRFFKAFKLVKIANYLKPNKFYIDWLIWCSTPIFCIFKILKKIPSHTKHRNFRLLLQF
jgi:hypothetical protein